MERISLHFVDSSFDLLTSAFNLACGAGAERGWKLGHNSQPRTVTCDSTSLHAFFACLV